MDEVWKPIEEMGGLYEISNIGNIRSLRNGKVRTVKKCVSTKGYYFVHITINKFTFRRKIHRLVAMAFIENPLNKPQVNHKDLNKLNNSIENLEWVTAKENIHHALLNGCYKNDKNFWGTRKPVIGFNITNGYIIESESKKACSLMGFNRNLVANVCSGKMESHRRYKFIEVKQNVTESQ